MSRARRPPYTSYTRSTCPNSGVPVKYISCVCVGGGGDLKKVSISRRSFKNGIIEGVSRTNRQLHFLFKINVFFLYSDKYKKFRDFRVITSQIRLLFHLISMQKERFGSLYSGRELKRSPVKFGKTELPGNSTDAFNLRHTRF